jgi:hypothetical protein
MPQEKLAFDLIKNSFSPYPSLSLYRQMDGVTDKETNTLAVRGLEDFFFQLCCYVSFLVSGGKWILVLLTYVSRVQYSCGVVLLFGSGRKWFLVLHTFLVYNNTLVWLCQYFGCGGK